MRGAPARCSNRTRPTERVSFIHRACNIVEIDIERTRLLIIELLERTKMTIIKPSEVFAP